MNSPIISYSESKYENMDFLKFISENYNWLSHFAGEVCCPTSAKSRGWEVGRRICDSVTWGSTFPGWTVGRLVIFWTEILNTLVTTLLALIHKQNGRQNGSGHSALSFVSRYYRSNDLLCCIVKWHSETVNLEPIIFVKLFLPVYY